MNIVIYQIIKGSKRGIFITKKNKKPLHKKPYRNVIMITTLPQYVYIYIEQCLAIEANTLISKGPSRDYISIDIINNNEVTVLTIDENIKIQNMLVNCRADERIKVFPDLAIYS